MPPSQPCPPQRPQSQSEQPQHQSPQHQSANPPSPSRRHQTLSRRAALAAAAASIVAAGLASRTGLAGIAGDAAGGILYAALLYVLLAFVVPRGASAAVAGAAVVFCGGIELFQLTPWPAQWGSQWPPVRLVFGTTFNPWDFPAYAAGGVAAGLLDRLLRTRRS